MASIDSFARDWDARIDRTETALDSVLKAARRHRLIAFGFVAIAPPLVSAAGGALVAGRLSMEAAVVAFAVLAAVFSGALISWAQAARCKSLELGEKAELIRTFENVSTCNDAGTMQYLLSRQDRLRRVLAKR